jgi:hypothetical protein
LAEANDEEGAEGRRQKAEGRRQKAELKKRRAGVKTRKARQKSPFTIYYSLFIILAQPQPAFQRTTDD